METAVISYRVADFLKKHPPFNAIDDADLLAHAARGRVRFHEPNEFVLWQGEPHRYQVFVIQQGTASLWDEAGGEAHLRDVRGAGDLIGVERYNNASKCLYSVRSESDLVIYAFPGHCVRRRLGNPPSRGPRPPRIVPRTDASGCAARNPRPRHPALSPVPWTEFPAQHRNSFAPAAH